MISIEEIYWKLLNNEYIDWIYISIYCNITDDFIDEFQTKLDWDFIWEKRKLSLEFIERWIQYANWDTISQYQDLSEQFILKWSDKINWETLLLNYSLLTETKIKLMRECNIYDLNSRTNRCDPFTL